MNKGTVIVLLVVVAGGSYALAQIAHNKDGSSNKEKSRRGHGRQGRRRPTRSSATSSASAFPSRARSAGRRTRRSPSWPSRTFSVRSAAASIPTLDKIMKDYPTQVRLYFRHNPLPFHPDAPLASEAALAAQDQGKFWEMHDKLFANQQNIKRPDLEKYAGELGLDMGKFKRRSTRRRTRAASTPTWRSAARSACRARRTSSSTAGPITGAVPYEEFKKVIDDEIARADKLLAKGTAPNQLYATFMAAAKTAPSPAAPAQAGKGPGAGPEVYKVAVGDAPTKGGHQPKVTIVEFSDFQCPYCGRVTPTLDSVLKDYGNDVELAFRHNPLPFHNNAMIAAEAAEAARDQGKFWQMHDKLFANQGALDRPNLEKYAQEIGLDMGKFKSALDGDKYKDRIKKDMDDAATFGARGTPNFFINGHNFRGAQPLEAFKSVVDDEIKKADAEDQGRHAARTALRGDDQGRSGQGRAAAARAAAPG